MDKEKVTPTEQQNEVTIDKVQKAVCDYFNITLDTLLSKTRKRQIVQARQIAMYLSRNLSIARFRQSVPRSEERITRQCFTPARPSET